MCLCPYTKTLGPKPFVSSTYDAGHAADINTSATKCPDNKLIDLPAPIKSHTYKTNVEFHFLHFTDTDECETH